MSLLTRPLGLRRRTVGGEFSPLDIDWHTLFWADEITGLGDGDPVATWADSSGNGHDATQSTAAKRPVFRPAFAGFNGHAVVEFDGVDDWLATSPFATPPAGGEVALIVQRTGSSTDQRHYFDGTAPAHWAIGSRQGGGSNRFIYQGTPGVNGGTEDNAKHYLRVNFGAVDTLHVDGTQVVSANVGTQTLPGIRLGANGDATTAFFPGPFALLGFKASALTPTEQANMLAWSRSYYGTP